MPWRAANVDGDMVLGALWDNAQVGLAIVGKDGRWLVANRTLCMMLEYAEAELRRMKVHDITHPGDIDADAEMAADLARQVAGGYDMVARYLTKTQRVVFLSLRVVPIVAPAGEFAAALYQLSPVVPIAGATEERRVRASWRAVREWWPAILAVLSALGVVAGATIQWMHRQ